MDGILKQQLCDNSHIYKMSLERIIDKYSKLQYQEGGVEVDLGTTKARALERYMKLSKRQLNELESKSLTDLREESLRAQDITRDSQLDFTHEDCGADETASVSAMSSVSTTQLSVADDGMTASNTTRLTVSSLDESGRGLSETELQPEDQDEELEMSLKSHATSLVELYPSMISRIERAWHRQHVSEAADSVLRRYRRWRQHSNRSYLNNTFVVTLRHPKKMNGKARLKENCDSPVESQFMETETSPPSPLQIITNQQDWQTQQQSPGRARGSLRREPQQPIYVMDLSARPEPKESSLNETFTVALPEVSQLGEPSSAYAVSPSRPCYPAAKASLDLSLRSKRLSLAARSPKTGGCSTYVSKTTAVKERPDVYGSPVRQSPSNARMTATLGRSPHAFSRSPNAYSVERFSREPTRPRSMSTSLSSPRRKPTVQQRMLYPPFHHSSQPQLPSPHSATAAPGRPRLRRHLSFDSSVPSTRMSCSLQKLDEDFIKLYHKFVCQNKSSFFNGPPCRFCARSSEAGSGHSSSALAALALSPHRSLLRKRHRELSWDSHPQSKRFRDDCCTSSPGSKRHGNEMLRRRLRPSECEQSDGGLPYSPSKHGMFGRFSAQQRPADAHQETWMSRGRRVSAAEFSGLGSSLESTLANGFSPRKWW